MNTHVLTLNTLLSWIETDLTVRFMPTFHCKTSERAFVSVRARDVVAHDLLAHILDLGQFGHD